MKCIYDEKFPVRARVSAEINENTNLSDEGYILNHQFNVEFYSRCDELAARPLITVTVIQSSPNQFPNHDAADISVSMECVDADMLYPALEYEGFEEHWAEYLDYRYVMLQAAQLATALHRDIINGIQGSWGDVMTDKQYIESEYFKPLKCEIKIDLRDVPYHY